MHQHINSRKGKHSPHSPKFRRVVPILVIIGALTIGFLCGFTAANKPVQLDYSEEEMAAWTEGQRYAHIMASFGRAEGLSENHQVIAASKEYWHSEVERQALAEETADLLHQFLFSGILPYEVTYDPAWEAAAVALAKAAYSEYNGADWDQYAAVMWTAINRAFEQYLEAKAKDADLEFNPTTIVGAVTYQGQFAYSSANGTTHKILVARADGSYESVEYDLLSLARDVLYRFRLELTGISDVGRILPYSCTLPNGVEAPYKYFNGKNGANWFGYNFPQKPPYWDFSWESPYTSGSAAETR